METILGGLILEIDDNQESLERVSQPVGVAKLRRGYLGNAVEVLSCLEDSPLVMTGFRSREQIRKHPNTLCWKKTFSKNPNLREI